MFVIGAYGSLCNECLLIGDESLVRGEICGWAPDSSDVNIGRRWLMSISANYDLDFLGS